MIDLFIAQQNSLKTKQTYRMGIERFRRWMQDHGYNGPTVPVVVAYKDWLVNQSGLSNRTQTTYWDAIKSYHAWLQRNGHTKLDPVAAVKAPSRVSSPVPHVPTDAEVQALLALDLDPRSRALLCLLLNGLRVSEACLVSPTDLVGDGEAVLLRVLGKGKKERRVPLMPMTLTALQSAMYDRVGYLQSAGVPVNVNYLLSGGYGDQPLPIRTAQGLIHAASQKAGIVGLTPHSLRHHYGTRMVRAGVDAFHLQKLLGHASVQTTQRYVSLDTVDLVEAAKRDPLYQKED